MYFLQLKLFVHRMFRSFTKSNDTTLVTGHLNSSAAELSGIVLFIFHNWKLRVEKCYYFKRIDICKYIFLLAQHLSHTN